MLNKRRRIIAVMMITANVLFTVHLYSQEQEKERNFSFQINPLKFFGLVFEDKVQVELDSQFRITNYWSIMLRPNISVGNINQNDITLSLMPGVIFRPSGTGLRGVYIGLYPNIGWQNLKMDKTTNNYMIIGAGAEAGYSWIFNRGFTLTVGGGVLKNRSIELNNAKRKDEEERIWGDFRMTLLLGYSF